MGVVCPLVSEDIEKTRPFPQNEEFNPISLAIERCLGLSPENEHEQVKVFNVSLMIGKNLFKLSKQVQNWIKEYDYYCDRTTYKMRGIVYLFNDNIPPLRALVIDFPNKIVRFEGE